MIRESTKELAKRAKEITIEEWNNTPLNMYERYFLMDQLSNETFIAVCTYYNQQTSNYPKTPVTYDEAVLALLFPELINRFQQLKIKTKEVKPITYEQCLKAAEKLQERLKTHHDRNNEKPYSYPGSSHIAAAIAVSLNVPIDPVKVTELNTWLPE